MNMWLSAWRMSLAMQSQWLKSYKTIQDMQSRLLEYEQPHAFPTAFLSEDSLRESFHALANGQLRQWEDIAALYQSLPDWMRDMHGKPGSYLTDFFDNYQVRR